MPVGPSTTGNSSAREGHDSPPVEATSSSDVVGAAHLSSISASSDGQSTLARPNVGTGNSSNHVASPSGLSQHAISGSSGSQWHLISPTTRPLILEILEITSLTLTLALSLNPQARFRSRANPNSSLSATGTNQLPDGVLDGATPLSSGGTSSNVASATHTPPPQATMHSGSTNASSTTVITNTGGGQGLDYTEASSSSLQHPPSTSAGPGVGPRHRRKNKKSTSAQKQAGGLAERSNTQGNPSSGTNSAVGTSGAHHSASFHAHDSDDELTAVEDSDPYPVPGSIDRLHGRKLKRSPNSAGSAVIGPTFKELLSNGIVVTVNGQPWNRIVAHVNDEDGLSTHSDYHGDAALRSRSNHEPEHPGNASGIIRDYGVETEARNASEIGSSSNRTSSTNHSGALQLPQDHSADRAVVVIYGLEAGKEYDVDLKVMGLSAVSSSESGKSTAPIGLDSAVFVRTPRPETSTAASSVSGGSGNRSRANSIRQARPTGLNGGRSRSASLIQQAQQPQTATGNVSLDDSSLSDAILKPKPEPIELFPHVTPTVTPLEAHAAQLRLLIAGAISEREELQSQLKKTRKDAQKYEASLRSEIEALKRAIEKTVVTDQRARQKSLALQEQVKQAFAAATEAEKEHDSMVESLPDLEKQEIDIKKEWEQLSEEKDKVLKERDQALEIHRKEAEELDAEKATIVSKIEKQKSKKAKIEKENEELRQKLEDVANARREVEKRNDAIRQQRMLVEDYGGGRPYDWSRPYNPAPVPNRNFNVQPSGPGVSRTSNYAGPQQAAAQALATQGIPKSAATTSHVGNPAGFYRPKGLSPMLALAAPFVPQAGHPSPPATSPSPTTGEHTSLVPPQLQHRIYLPRRGAGRSPQTLPVKPPSEPAAFPPLPTQSSPVLSEKAPVSPSTGGGPTLASIVTRAIIPQNSALMTRSGEDGKAAEALGEYPAVTSPWPE